jgi:GT2 family glycosyltransferase
MRAPQVFIVTPAFNARHHISGFLASVSRQSYKKISLVIIDDGSVDDTVRIINEEYPHAAILHGDGTLWWSGCTNMGVEYAKENGADYIFTVNVDVQLDSRCIEELVRLSARQPHTLFGSTICDIKNKTKVWYFGGYWDRPSGDIKHATGTVKSIGNSVKHPDWLTGMGALIPIGAYDNGLYDAKNFPHYFGDADFSLRAARAGYKLAVSPKAFVYADLSSSWLEKWLAKPSLSFFWNIFTSKRSQYNVHKRYLFYRRHWGAGFRRALIKLYFHSLFPLYRLWAVLYIKRLLGKL